MRDLKPCPFCGSENLKYSRFMSGVRCNECGAMSPASLTKAGSISWWNYRHEQTCKVVKSEYIEKSDVWEVELSCGHADVCVVSEPQHCSYCGAKVVE